MSSSHPILDWMRQNNVELTRENYLELEFCGDVPDELDPEIEASLPPEFQEWDDLGPLEEPTPAEVQARDQNLGRDI